MAKKRTAMDGFIPRRPERRVGGIIGGERPIEKSKDRKSEEDEGERLTVAAPSRRELISRAEIDESLNGIDDDEAREPKKRRKNKGGVSSPRKKWIKRIALIILLILVVVGAYVGIRALIAGSNIFQGNIFDLFQNVPLKQDANGRSNIIVVGTSEDDPGHPGSSLTDSMMIISLDQKNKNAFMISIPRDLYVKYGRACNSGYSGKINEYYNCVHEGTGPAQDRAALMKEADFIGNIAGLDIQYGVNVNYTVMRELVKAVGGSITVNIEGDGTVPYGVKPGSVMDSNFDWKCGANYYAQIKKCPPNGHFIEYGPGPVKLDAEHALYLAQARGDHAPTYGFAQSNFDREKNQQKIIEGLREKAISAGVLSDFGKVTSIIDALGKNLRTTFMFKEFRTLVSLAKDIKSKDIQSISLIDGDNPIMTTGQVFGASQVFPSAGLYDYSQMQALIHQKLSNNPVVREAAPVLVLNGSGVTGTAQTEADKLKAAGYTIAGTGDAPKGSYGHYVIYKIGDGNDGTASKLESLYHVKITKGKLPVATVGAVKFVVIIGPASGN